MYILVGFCWRLTQPTPSCIYMYCITRFYMMESEEVKGIKEAEVDEMWSFVGKKSNQ